MFAGIAEFERSLIAERTRKGREAARARGVKFGPKPRLSAEQLSHGRALVEQGCPVKEVAALLKVHRATLYRALFRFWRWVFRRHNVPGAVQTLLWLTKSPPL